MKKAFYVLLSLMLLGGAYSCTDDTNIGSSIAGTQMEIVADSSFQITGSSVENKAVLTRTMTQLLGAVKASNYGELTSDFVSQFLSSRNLDTTGMAADRIDSIKLILRMPLGAYTGDSIVPMRLNVYKLSKQLESPINSTFNPDGYYSKGDLLGTTSYTATKNGAQKFLSGYIASALDTTYYRSIAVKLPKSLGVDLFNEFVNNPSTFASPENFAKFFPGIYATTSYGSGRVVNIDKNFLFLNFRRKVVNSNGNDTIVKDSMSFASAAPEVITNNNIRLKVADSIKKMIASGSAIIQAPVGFDIAVNFPVQNIIDKYNSDNSLKVLNNIIFEIPAEVIENECGIAPPKYLLLVKASEKDAFFAENKIADNTTSFYATYNSSTKKYVFSEMRGLILDVIKKQNGIAKPEDSAFVLTPIDVTTETSSGSYYYQGTTTITSMAPSVSGPSIAKLNLDEAKIKMVYSKQLLKN